MEYEGKVFELVRSPEGFSCNGCAARSTFCAQDAEGQCLDKVDGEYRIWAEVQHGD